MNLPKSIKETQEGLIKRKFKAVNLVDEYLSRIENENPKLNAYITISSDLAYRQAQKIDEIIENSKSDILNDYPLLGVVVSHKDLFLTEGVRTTAGSKVLESYVPTYSGTVVKNFEKAGGITIGKTNCDAWAHGASGENSDFGPTKNPYNTDIVPGGSSSGSAVSVAKEMSLVATGTDTGGSIRLPANFCGVWGLKPTYGAVSRYGVVAMASSLDSIGHFANNVDDIERVFNVIKGEDGFDSTVVNAPLIKPRKDKLRVGVPKEYFIEGLDKDVEKSVLGAIEKFKENEVEFVDISLPNTKYSIATYYIIQPAEVSSNLGRYDGVRFGNDRGAFGDEAKRRIMLGTYVLSAGYYDAFYLKAMKVRSRIIQDFEEAWEKVDAIIAPVSPTPPFKLGDKTSDPLKMYIADIFTAPANLAGIPGLAIPSGFTQNGLPLGFQLLGPRFSEPVLFELGRLYERI